MTATLPIRMRSSSASGIWNGEGGRDFAVTEKPKPESSEDDAEFERVLRNLVNTPHKPHQAGKQPVKTSPKMEKPA